MSIFLHFSKHLLFSFRLLRKRKHENKFISNICQLFQHMSAHTFRFRGARPATYVSSLFRIKSWGICSMHCTCDFTQILFYPRGLSFFPFSYFLTIRKYNWYVDSILLCSILLSKLKNSSKKFEQKKTMKFCKTITQNLASIGFIKNKGRFHKW